MNIVKPGPNPEAVQADLERRRSNAARPIPSRKQRRQGSRSAQKQRAIKEAS